MRSIAASAAPVMFQAGGRTTPAHLAVDHQVDVLRDLRKAGWIVLEEWVAEPRSRGHARRRYSAAQAYCPESGREACGPKGLSVVSASSSRNTGLVRQGRSWYGVVGTVRTSLP